MVQTLLVPLDGSPLAERALPYATALTRALAGKLVLLYARPTRALVSGEAPSFDLEAVAQPLRADGLEVRVVVQPIYGDDTARAILDGAATQRAELIAMSTHGRSGLGRWIFGSVAEALLARAETPVLLVPASVDRAWPTDLKLRILVPLDGLPLAETALGPVGELAAAVEVELLLLRAVGQVSEEYRTEDSGQVARRQSLEFDAAHEYLARVAERVRSGIPNVEQLAIQGAPATVIGRVAREHGVDLIAMATHARTGAERLVLGSTAIGVLHRVGVPLLLVPARAVAVAP